MAIDASLTEAERNEQNSTPKEEWDASTIDTADALQIARDIARMKKNEISMALRKKVEMP